MAKKGDKSTNMKLLLCTFYTILLTARAKSSKISNGESTQCVPLRSCPLFLEILNKNVSSIPFTRELICGFNGTDLMVHCNLLTRLKNQTKRLQRQTDDDSLLPDQSYCGYQHSDDFEHGVTGTLITEFPWLARVVSKIILDDGSYKKFFICLGSVISNRYILTTADCANPPGFTPTEVELGEYNILTKIDCVFETDIEECNDPVGDYEIEKIVVHPNYNTECITNNIALLRLRKKLFFNDYIRPICLPLFPGLKSPNVGDILITSGWGFINSERKEAVIKKKVLTKLISSGDCLEQYKDKPGVVIDEKNVCVLRVENSTEMSCIGDSGSPVMFSHRLQWYQIGIVSVGIGDCGDKFPDILTRVESYMDWIKENIKP